MSLEEEEEEEATHGFFTAIDPIAVANDYFTADCGFREIFFPAASSMSLYGLIITGKGKVVYIIL